MEEISGRPCVLKSGKQLKFHCEGLKDCESLVLLLLLLLVLSGVRTLELAGVNGSLGVIAYVSRVGPEVWINGVAGTLVQASFMSGSVDVLGMVVQSRTKFRGLSVALCLILLELVGLGDTS